MELLRGYKKKCFVAVELWKKSLFVVEWKYLLSFVEGKLRFSMYWTILELDAFTVGLSNILRIFWPVTYSRYPFLMTDWCHRGGHSITAWFRFHFSWPPTYIPLRWHFLPWTWTKRDIFGPPHTVILPDWTLKKEGLSNFAFKSF